MQRYHQEALKKNRVMLARELVLKELMEHMIEKDIITIEMVEMIQVCKLNSIALLALFLPKLSVTLGTSSIVKFLYFLPVCLVSLFGQHMQQHGSFLQLAGALEAAFGHMGFV